MKVIKSTVLKLIFLLFIFIATIVFYFVITYEETKDPTETISTATLPVIIMKYQDKEINILHGYTIAMKGQYMRTAITPYGDDGKIELDIERYENIIAGISYEIRSADTKRLIVAEEVKEWVSDGNDMYLAIQTSSIMQKEEEYLLIIKLITETHGNVYYYVNLKNPAEHDIENQLAFVSDFSRLAIKKEASEKYRSYLEYDPKADSTSLAYVDIKSSYDNIDWGNLNVTRETEPIVTIKEILGKVGCYELEYKVMADDEYGNRQYYNVTEYFRLRTNYDVMYLDVYERHANQIFDPATHTISSSRINLGLDDDLNVHHKTNSTGSFVAFVKEGSMFLLDMEENKMTEIFSFEKLNEEDVRIENNNFDIEILSVDSKGNTMFLVYGYMAKGAHEGQVGVALYLCDYKSNSVKELVFVPSDKPFHIFKDSVGKFAYMTDENLLYFMVGNSIYTVTMDSNEYMQLVTGLTEGNYIINEYNNILAWHENASVYNADSIRIIDVDAERDYVLKADEGDKVKVIGFIGNDLIYGSAHAKDIYQDTQGKTIFPMYKVNVILYNEKNKEKKEKEDQEDEEEQIETYQKENIYVTDISIKENVMTFARKIKNADGSFTDTSEDKYVNRKGEDKNLVTLSRISTDLKKTELTLTLAYTITSDNKFESVSTENIQFVNANTLDLEQSEYVTNKYYVYGSEGLMGIYNRAGDAVTYANSVFGTVVEDSGKLFWGRIIKPELAKLSDTSALISKGYTSLEMAIEDADYETVDISGVDISALLYFGAYDIPILTYLNDYGCVILSAYSGYKGNIDTLAFTLCQSGEIIKMPYQEAKNALEGAGARYLAVKKK